MVVSFLEVSEAIKGETAATSINRRPSDHPWYNMLFCSRYFPVVDVDKYWSFVGRAYFPEDGSKAIKSKYLNILAQEVSAKVEVGTAGSSAARPRNSGKPKCLKENEDYKTLQQFVRNRIIDVVLVTRPLTRAQNLIYEPQRADYRATNSARLRYRKDRREGIT